MTREELQQRIRYLVEHGGLYEDPQDEIKRGMLINRLIAVSAVVMVMIDLALELARL